MSFHFRQQLLHPPIQTWLKDPHKIRGYVENPAVLNRIVEAIARKNV